MQRWLFAFVVSSSLGAQAPSPDVGIFRHREELTELTFRDTEGRPVVSDEQVGLIEREIESGLGVPTGWRVVLRRIREDGSRDVLSTLTQTEDAELLHACLVDVAGRELGFGTSLDLRWVRLGNVMLLGDGGVTNFTREQPAKCVDWFPLRSLPILLETLEHELARGALRECESGFVGLEAAQPLGPTPSVRAYTLLEDRAAFSSFGARGALTLPSAAAHEVNFVFTGEQTCDDSMFEPPDGATSFRDSLDQSLALRDTFATCTPWSASIHADARTGGWWISLSDRRLAPQSPYPFSIAADAAPPRPGLEPSFTIGGVELSPRGIHAVLDALSAEYDPECAAPLIVFACRERREIAAIFSDLPLRGAFRVRAPALRITLDEEGDSLQSIARVAVREVRRTDEGEHTHWSCEFADACRADSWRHRPVLCGNDVDLTPRGEFDGQSLVVVGGLIDSYFIWH